MGSKRFNLGSEKPVLGSEGPDLGSEKCSFRSEKHDLESKRPDLRLGGTRKNCPVWNHRSFGPSGLLPKHQPKINPQKSIISSQTQNQPT